MAIAYSIIITAEKRETETSGWMWGEKPKPTGLNLHFHEAVEMHYRADGNTYDLDIALL